MRELTTAGIIIRRCSDLYITEPWGGAEGGDYTNVVMEIERFGAASDMLRMLQDIERLMGRTRQRTYDPRRCDLDLLLWDEAIINTTDLMVPHPRIAERRFVLTPLCDLIPDSVHPKLNRTFRELLDSCSDPLRVRCSGPANLPEV